MQLFEKKFNSFLNEETGKIKVEVAMEVTTTIIDTIDKELTALEHANGKLNVLVKYFERRQENDKKEEVSKQKG